MRWSESETCQFVKLYLSYEYLWNSHHEHYKLKDKRLKAYKEIIAEFKSSTGIALTLGELKMKIKNLRSTYSQELLKIRQRSGPDYTYKPTIKWFAYWHMRFKNQSRTNQSANNADNEDNDNDLPYEEVLCERDTPKIWVDEDMENLNEVIIEAEEDSLPQNDYIILPKSDSDDSPIRNFNISNSYNVKKKKIKLRSPSNASEGHCHDSVDFVDLCKSDEFDIYGKYIASQLRSMNLKKALKLQLEIQSLVSEARISEL